MKVFLRADIDRLGKLGEMVNVAPGYARNYLIPKKLAYLATSGNLKRIEFEKRSAAQQAEHEVEEARKQAEKMKDLSLTFQVKVGEEEKLYGSVTAADITEEAAKHGFEIDRRRVLLEEPIKQLGVYTIQVLLHPQVNAEVKIWVVKE